MTKIMDQEAIRRAIQRISHEILEKNKGLQDLCIIGIRTRGAVLADRILQAIKQIEGEDVPLGILDITLYRDDLTTVDGAMPKVHQTKIDFDVDGKTIILVDDVLYTGRTVRCALSEIMDFGRPQRIELCVLVDRGHRELPIRADFVGKNIPTSAGETVEVRLEESEGKDEVVICEEVK